MSKAMKNVELCVCVDKPVKGARRLWSKNVAATINLFTLNLFVYSQLFALRVIWDLEPDVNSA